ncbi:hypothetical protein GCM10011607_28970 [Shewanella inventionis]|uniref:Uncharacterized protein n=1 Tax=Shewanella inventionis TaxID=1738770 RepID=A0ABQ1JHM1_9GAMM|nr:hypothetical protein [Shewanella inventionis]GGB66546.1 hypothetical protein GCM10011607_28970 [Shewanella inventionis]
MLPSNGIFIFGAEEQSFNSSSHLTNFIKYLFSDSTNHQANELTAHNAFFYAGKSGKAGRFVNDNKAEITLFKDFIANEKLTYQSCIMDIHYLFFLIEINGKLFSNIVGERNGKLVMYLNYDTFMDIAHEYFYDEPHAFENALMAKIEQCNVNPIHISEPSISESDRRMIELALHKQVKRFCNRDTIISISHGDQSSAYHIHRITRRS